MNARDEILHRIDDALAFPHSRPASDDWEKISREYVRQDSLSHDAVLDLFEHRLLDYDSSVTRSAPENLVATITRMLVGRNAKRMLVPAALSGRFGGDCQIQGVQFVKDVGFSHEELNCFDGVMTGATAAIAATGTIVLQHGPDEGRRALTLIPDYHLCIVYAEQIFETVPAAFRRLDPSRLTTFISGPSATADIEMTRIKGVHGPRSLDAVIVCGCAAHECTSR